MRQIVIMSVVAIMLLVGAVTLVVIMGRDAEFTGNPVEAWSVGEKTEKVTSAVKGSVSSATREVRKQAPQDKFNVRMPEGLTEVQFGASVDQMTEAFPPEWRKTEAGNLTFAHYPDETQRRYYVFQFDSSGLARLEIRVKPDDEQTLDDLYSEMMAQTASRFGDSTNESRRRWRGQDLIAVLKKRGNCVSLRYTPTNK